MSVHATSEPTFLRDFVKELHNKNAAAFLGAGLSVGSGYVDWRSLLADIFDDLGLDPDREENLVAVAQYHCNKVGGKAKLTQTILDHFAETKEPTDNHRLLASMPIQTYWTTNYDKLMEEALRTAKRVPDVKYTVTQLATTRLDRDAVVYKMHGDVDHAAEAVISRDDYEQYPSKMQPFISALRGDLIERTFVFLGFSFTDPNLDYILSRVRVQYEKNQRQHFCIMRTVAKQKHESEQDFSYRRLKQDYFIADLKRFAIQTVLVNEFGDITRLLRAALRQYHRHSIFISGAAHAYEPWTQSRAAEFIHGLSYSIAKRRNQIVSGFGLGVGDAVINGVLAYLSDANRSISEDAIVMRPFPQVATGEKSLPQQWTAYRQDIAARSGIAIFLFGNKVVNGAVSPSIGMDEEFKLCNEAGVCPLPIGATGYKARELWAQVDREFTTFYPNASPNFRRSFQCIGDEATAPEKLIESIHLMLDELQKA